MIKAVLLVACLMVVVAAIVVLVNFYNKRNEIPKYRGMEYDPKTKTYYNPTALERTEKDGVVSFKSKSK